HRLSFFGVLYQHVPDLTNTLCLWPPQITECRRFRTIEHLPQTPSHEIKDLRKQPYFAPCMEVGAVFLRRVRRATESCHIFLLANFAACQARLSFAKPFSIAFGPLGIEGKGQ